MHIGELLPEVLPAIYSSFRKAKDESTEHVETIINNNEVIINEIITAAFIEKNDQIKQNRNLTDSFESFLELLIEYNFELAAVVLDEFRIH